jgi:hypothetical protein
MAGKTKKLNVEHFQWPEPMIPPVKPRKSRTKKSKSKKTKVKPGFGEERVPSDSWPFWKPKYIGVRKGDTVKNYNVGGLLPPPGAGQGTAPQAKVNPNTDKDRRLKDNALKKKQMDIAAAQAKAPPVPGMQPKAPPVPGQAPRMMGRKGGKIKMRGGGSVPKSYSNTCKSPVPRA